MGPSSVTIGNGTMGTRYGLGTTLVLPAGTYALGQSTSIADPANPGHQWVQAVPASGTTGMVVNAANWSFVAETWTVSAQFAGLPVPSGSLSITCDVYNGSTLLGTLSSDGSASFDGTSLDNVFVSCSGSMPAIALGASDNLRFDVKVTTSAITVQIGPQDFSGGFSGFASVQFGTAPTVGSGGSYFDPGVPGAAVPPTSSGTTVPFPDSNRPGLTPAGCPQEGPNVDPSQIDIPAFPDTLPTTLTPQVGDSFMSFAKTIVDALNCSPLRVILSGTYPNPVTKWTLRRAPYVDSAVVPASVWRFSNEDGTTDGKILPPITERVIDWTNAVNAVFVRGDSNTQTTVVSATRTNDGTISSVSRAFTHRTIHRVVKDSTIVTQDEADTRAELERQKGAEGTDSVSFKTYVNPMLQIGDPFDLYIVDPFTAEVVIDSAGDGNPYFLTSIESVVISNGQIDATSQITGTRTILL